VSVITGADSFDLKNVIVLFDGRVNSTAKINEAIHFITFIFGGAYGTRTHVSVMNNNTNVSHA
jgi:hypothetical protein